MSIKFPNFLAMVLLTGLLGACSNNDSTNPNGGTNNGIIVTDALSGNWSVCNQFTGTSTYFRETYSNNTFTRIKGDFTNNTCSGQPANGYQELYYGTYDIGAEIAAGIYELDLHMERAFGAPLTYDLYELYSIQSNTLYHGDASTGVGDTPANRPTALDTINVFYLEN